MSSVSVSRLLASDINTRQTSFSLTINTKALDAIPDQMRDTIKKLVGKGVLDLRFEVIAQIRQKNLIKTGNLMNSVTASQSLDGMSGTVEVGAFYGIYLEFGTVRRAATPFFGPAVDSFEKPWIETVERNIRRVLESYTV